MNLEAFIQFLRPEDRAERTITGYAQDLAKFITWFEQSTGRQVEPAIITPLDIRAYRQHLLVVRRLKLASINRQLAALRVYFRWASEVGLVATKPAVSLSLIKNNSRPITFDRRGGLISGNRRHAAARCAGGICYTWELDPTREVYL